MVGAIVFLVVGEACPVAISLSAGCAAIIHEGSIDVLDSGGAIHFERLGFGLWGSQGSVVCVSRRLVRSTGVAHVVGVVAQDD